MANNKIFFEGVLPEESMTLDLEEMVRILIAKSKLMERRSESYNPKKKSIEGVLPEELMTEALVRLPVKTLQLCKSVSKPWLSFISNPNFIKSHLHYVINKNNNNPILLDILVPVIRDPNRNVVTFPNGFRSYRRPTCVFDVFVLGTGPALSSRALSVWMPSVFRNCRVVGTSCCDGILCLRDDVRNVFYLWNPAIKKYKEVRVPELNVLRVRRAEIGFGYACSDYKVFMILCDVSLGSHVPLKLHVYSVNTDSWREFRGPVWGNKLEGGIFQRNECNVVNGILYFSNGVERQVISFDLQKEVFRVVSFPSFVQRRCSDVLEFKGSVAMAFESVSGVDLWRLDDDVSGQVSSWTKMFSIETDPKLDMWLGCYLGAGQFYGQKLMDENMFVNSVVYDLEKKETKYYQLGEDNILATLKYRETLVSLEGFHSRKILEDLLH